MQKSKKPRTAPKRPRATLQEQVSTLAESVESLRPRTLAIVPILTFAPAPYEPIGNLQVVIEESDAGFAATLYDANLSMCGESETDALEALKTYIVQVLNVFEKEPHLGPEPRRQLAVLKSLIRRKK